MSRFSIQRSGSAKTVMMVASGGGHWIQLLRLREVLGDARVVYVTTMRSAKAQLGNVSFYAVRDASRWNKLGLCLLAARILWIVIKERPEVVITTGAACGYFAVRIAKLLRKRTVWIDSMANVEQLSLSGAKAGRYADLWLTQWPHLATPDGPEYFGAVL
jgi:hypothetical protein